jgi:hypothetical protein
MGKPGWGHAQSLAAEYIGRSGQTGGTETSQYPEEEKANAIPLVAASERGKAQTANMLKPVRVVLVGLWGLSSLEYGSVGARRES